MINYDTETNYNNRHFVKVKLMFGEHTSEFIGEVTGNCYGSSIIENFLDFEIGISVNSENKVNKKHCIFEKSERKFKYIDGLRFFHKGREEIIIMYDDHDYDLNKYIIGIEIIDIKEEI